MEAGGKIRPSAQMVMNLILDYARHYAAEFNAWGLITWVFISLMVLVSWLISFRWTKERPKWIVIEERRSGVWRVFWSKPTKDGKMFYSYQFSGPMAEELARNQAEKCNRERRVPVQ